MRLAPYSEQPAAHDLEVEILRLVGEYRRRHSIECIGQALLAAFYRTCAHEAKGDLDSARFLAKKLLEGGVTEYVLACKKEQEMLADIQLEAMGSTLQ